MGTDDQARPLRSAEDVLHRWQRRGGTTRAALTVVAEQAAAISEMLADDAAWARLLQIAGRTADPWFATDWPDTFDALVLVLPLCKHKDWDCATCPLGVQQHGLACASPDVPVGRMGLCIPGGHRQRAKTELDVLQSMLRHAIAEHA